MTVRRIGVFAAFSCLIIGHLAFAPTAASQELLPNLRALPASNLSVAPNADTGNPELRLAATSWNSGVGPLVLVAGETDPGTNKQNVYQRVFTNGGSYNDYLAGNFIWHPEHNHFHFEQYAVYTLTPISSPGQSKRNAYKTSFCVMDTDKVNGRLPGSPAKPVYRTCFDTKQGMSIGWGDTYGAHLAGQAIDLTGLADGLYELTVQFDPDNRIRETNDNDNTACSLLDIAIAAGTVQTLGACGTTSGSGVTISSISPNSALAGSFVDAQISGTNFTPGIAVGFEGGSGPAPTVSNITVLNTNTISVTITVKSGGKPGNDPVWDLRVGSAIKPNAFTVLR